MAGDRGLISLGPLAEPGDRLAWTPALAAAEDWFRTQAEGIGLRVQRDPAGNLWACPDAPPPWWGVGSHLDTVREALLAVTLNAAWVLRMSGERGSLEAGKRADLIVLEGPAEDVPYRFGHDPVAVVVIGGEVVWVRPDQEWRLGR